MATTKVTFTLDTGTLALLDDAAVRLKLPKSQVVREAIADFHARIGRLTEAERVRLLQAFDEYVPRIPQRPAQEVERELKEIRQARRSSGRRSATRRNGS